MTDNMPPLPPMEVEEQPTPRAGREFPCEKCGAALKFVPGASALQCDYCGHKQTIPQCAEEVREMSFEELAAHIHVDSGVVTSADGERRCDGCGAMVLINKKLATDSCPFCGTHLDNPIAAMKPMMMPQAVLPFAISENTAKDEFRKWVKSRWFAPNSFTRMADLGRVSGLYVPYWTYDSMTWSWFRGERGDAYYVTVGSGKNKRRERRIRWSHVSGQVDHWFDDVLVCASHSVPDKLVVALEPWDLSALQSYRPDFLSGFQSERYQVDAKEGFGIARKIMDEVIRGLVRRRIGGDEQRIHSVSTQVGNITFKHVLLPIWLAAYRYQDKTFRVLINARTGEVQGERPWSWIKITLAVLLGIAIVAAIVVAGQNK